MAVSEGVNVEEITRQDFYKAAAHDPVLYAAYNVWRRAERAITFEQAVTWAALELSKQNRQMREELAACSDLR